MKKNNKNKILVAIDGHSIKQLVNKANELNIKRDDLVGIYKITDGYIMVYYYGSDNIEADKL